MATLEELIAERERRAAIKGATKGAPDQSAMPEPTGNARLDALLAEKQRRQGLGAPSQSAMQSGQPYYRAPDFAGQSYFDDTFAALNEEKQALAKNWRDPEYGAKYQDILAREKQLFADRKEWNQGFPEELSSLPELDSDSAFNPYSQGQGPQETTRGQRFGVMAVDMLAPEDKDRVAILENFGWQVDFVNGFPKITNPQTGQEFALNKPGISKRDVTDFLATAVQFAGAGLAPNLVKGVGRKIAVGAAASAATELTKQSLEGILGGEFDTGQVALAGLFGGATEGALPLLKGIWNKLSGAGREKLLNAKSIDDIRQLGVASEKEIAELAKMSEKGLETAQSVKEATGIDPGLTKAQITLNPSDLAKQRFLRQLDPSATKAMEELGQQNKRAEEITRKILESVAPESAIDSAGSSMRTAARETLRREVDMPLRQEFDSFLEKLAKPQKAEASAAAARKTASEIRDKLVEKRGAAADPVYKRAYRDAPQIDVRPVQNEALLALKRAPKGTDTAIKAKQVSDLLQGSPTLKQIQQAREQISKWINYDGENRLTADASRFLEGIRARLNKQIEQAAAEGQSGAAIYRKGDEIFSTLSKPIDEFDKSLMGAIARKENPTVESIAQEVFSGKWSSDQVAKARVALGRENWGALYRSYVESKAGKLSAETALPGDYLRQIFPDDRTSKLLLDNAPDEETRRGLMRLRAQMERGQARYGETIEGNAAQLSDSDLNAATKAIFSQQTTPTQVDTMRRIVTDNGGEGAWDAVLRKEIYDRSGGTVQLLEQQGADFIENAPARLKSDIFGNPKQRALLLRAASDEQRKNLLLLEDVLSRMAAGRAEGSPTGWRNAFMQQMRGAAGVVRDVFRSTRDTVFSAGEEAFVRRKIQALADVAFDPKYADKLAEVRKIGLGSPEAISEFEAIWEAAFRASAQSYRSSEAEPQEMDPQDIMSKTLNIK